MNTTDRPANRRMPLALLLLIAACFSCPAQSRAADAAGKAEAASTPERESPEAVPLAGQAFRTVIFGHDVTVPARDRRSTSAWNLGFGLYTPPPENEPLIPVAAIYLWRHPNEDRLLRAQLSGVYNEFLLARKVPGRGNLEWVFTFNNFTVPVARSELVDGRAENSRELTWGWVRPGFGMGYRRQVRPGYQDNMAAVDLTLEPGYLYFRQGSETSPLFAVPQDTVEMRAHLQFRWDALERNLLELPHRGFAAGADAVYGSRLNWENWGLGRSEPASGGRNYSFITAYALASGPVPGIASERHRLIGTIHAGIGRDLDRFSAFRIGGGPNPLGEEYESTSNPVLPGAAIGEFFPHHYAILNVEYRWQAVFFAYLGADVAVARLDRLRQSGAEQEWKNDTLTAAGVHLYSGFFFNSELQLGYHYNFSVVRGGQYGGQEIVLNVSKEF